MFDLRRRTDQRQNFQLGPRRIDALIVIAAIALRIAKSSLGSLVYDSNDEAKAAQARKN
jgi:hypothetical protein